MSRRIALPYLDPEILRPKTPPRPGEIPKQRAPKGPCIIHSKDYQVIDGDTIWVMGPPDDTGKRPMAFSIRFRTLDAAPKVRNTKIEKFFRTMGAPSAYTSGDAATRFLKEAAAGRPILYVPSPIDNNLNIRRDKHNRVLADVYISGTKGQDFEIANAKSVSHMMVERGYGAMNMKEKPAERRAEDALGMLLGHVTVDTTTTPPPKSIFEDDEPRA